MIMDRKTFEEFRDAILWFKDLPKKILDIFK